MHALVADIQQQTDFGPTGFGMEYDEVSSIVFCLQCLLYLEVAIYLLSKLFCKLLVFNSNYYQIV